MHIRICIPFSCYSNIFFIVYYFVIVKHLYLHLSTCLILKSMNALPAIQCQNTSCPIFFSFTFKIYDVFWHIELFNYRDLMLLFLDYFDFVIVLIKYSPTKNYRHINLYPFLINVRLTLFIQKKSRFCYVKYLERGNILSNRELASCLKTLQIVNHHETYPI